MLAQGAALPWAQDPAYVYWVEPSGALERVPKSGGATEPIGQAPAQCVDLQVLGGTLYCAVGKAIDSVPAGGGTLSLWSTVPDANATIIAMTSDGSQLYVEYRAPDGSGPAVDKYVLGSDASQFTPLDTAEGAATSGSLFAYLGPLAASPYGWSVVRGGWVGTMATGHFPIALLDRGRPGAPISYAPIPLGAVHLVNNACGTIVFGNGSGLVRWDGTSSARFPGLRDSLSDIASDDHYAYWIDGSAIARAPLP
jgi:hypothetical protein